MTIDLSIIIPAYNTHDNLARLLNILNRQIRDKKNIEVIVIDDHSDTKLEVTYPWLKYIYLDKNSGGASRPRNIGLDIAKGRYITFIDSDDLVLDAYLEKILLEIKKGVDIIFLSWKDKEASIIMNPKPYDWNCSVWCRVYKREIIGNTRFDENLKIAEDWKFNKEIKYNTFSSIKEIIYFYNLGREGSLLNGKH